MTIDQSARALKEDRPRRSSDIELGVESPTSSDAAACRDAYFAELSGRFEGGFDLALGRAARDEDMRPPAGAFVLARLKGQPVGCGGFARLDAGTGEIKRMWTAPGARGLGVARRILRELELLAREAGCIALRLDTNKSLVEAQAFYRREGYREIARYNDNPYADLWYEKRLGEEPA